MRLSEEGRVWSIFQRRLLHNTWFYFIFVLSVVTCRPTRLRHLDLVFSCCKTVIRSINVSSGTLNSALTHSLTQIKNNIVLFTFSIRSLPAWRALVRLYRRKVVHRVTSANKVAQLLWYPASVCLSACLSRHLEKLLTDLNQILWKDRLSAKNQSVGFWDWSRSVCVSVIFQFSNMERWGV